MSEELTLDESAVGLTLGEREAGSTVWWEACELMDDRCSSRELKSSWENVTGVEARSCSVAGDEAAEEPWKTRILPPVACSN